MSNTKIVHLTSVHPRHDTRVLFRNCVTLSENGYSVSLVVADGLGDEVIDSVQINDIGERCHGRLLRYIKTTTKIFQKAKELDADIYHFHDPELIFVGLKLKKLGKKVIFDIHDNIALQIKDKPYIPLLLRTPTSKLDRIFERLTVNKFNALILAEDSYQEYYKDLNKNCITVLNMPEILKLADSFVSNRSEIPVNEIFYLGSITKERGFDITLDTMEILKKNNHEVKINMVGRYSEAQKQQIKDRRLEDVVSLHGYMNLIEGYKLSRESKVGISVLEPIDNHIQSYSTKIFEYMAIGLPVITSNFKLYRNVIEKYECGICVDPCNPQEIADAIIDIIKNHDKSEQMARNGLAATKDYFNWGKQKEKLLKLYESI
jgi:glycosyltransferase involved in cell wall biosynthesis